MNTISWAIGHAADVCIANGLSPEEAGARLDFAVFALTPHHPRSTPQ